MIKRSTFILILLFCSQLNAMDKKTLEKKQSLVPAETTEKQIASAQQPQSPIIIPPSSGPTYIYNGSTTNHYTNNQANSASASESQAQAQAKNTTTLKSIMSNMQENIAPLPQHIQGWLVTHKWYVAGGTGLTLYLVISAFLLQGNSHLTSEASWGQWKRHLSVEELQIYCLDTQKKQEFTDNLIDTILNRYFNTRQPTNHIDPLIDFSNALDQEMKIMNRYIMIATILQKSRLIKLFPTNDAKIAQAQEYRRRLQCIKQLFTNKMAEYKLNQFLAPSKLPVPMPVTSLPTPTAVLVPIAGAPMQATPSIAPATPEAPSAVPAIA